MREREERGFQQVISISNEDRRRSTSPLINHKSELISSVEKSSFIYIELKKVILPPSAKKGMAFSAITGYNPSNLV